MKVCPQCHKEYDAGKFCLDCGVPLVDQQSPQQQPAGDFNLNLGDANAISGGVNMSDNHSVSHNTVNTTTSSVDSHNVITNNITHVEREKSKDELFLEGKQTFREACKQAFSSGMCTSEEKRYLDDLRFKLGLDDEIAAQIFENARLSVQRKSVVLGPIQKMTFENIKFAILNNNIDLVQRLYLQLTALVQKFAVEELQYTYYMLQSILTPDVCVKDFESHREDKYWQTFWASVAYRKVGDVVKSELLLVDVGSKWVGAIPEENTYVLAVIGAVLDKDIKTATSLYNQITGGQSIFLEPLVGCLYGILYSDMLSSNDIQQIVNNGAFYRDHLFANILQEKKEVKDIIVGESHSAKEKLTFKRKAPKVESKFDEQILSKYVDGFGYLRQLPPYEINKFKSLLLSAPKDNYQAQFQLGQLLIQEKDSAANLRLAYDTIKCASEHGVYEAGAYLAYFYLYGKVVMQDLDEAEIRIKIDENYKKNPIFIKMLIDLYSKKGNGVLVDIWKSKLSKLK